MKNYYSDEDRRFKIVKQYLKTFRKSGAIPDHDRMMKDIKALDEYVASQGKI